MTKTNYDCASQCRKVYHCCGLEPFLRIPHDVAQNQTALSVGIDNFNSVTFHRGHNVTWTHCIPRRHVFHQPNQTDDVRLCTSQSQSTHGACNDPRATHVHGHVFHSTSRFDADATRVKDDAFTNQSQRRFTNGPTVPLHDNHFGWAVRALTDAQKRSHSKSLKFGFIQHLYL